MSATQRVILRASHFSYSKLKALPLSLGRVKNPPKELYYAGNQELLQTPLKVAIVGTRQPSQYTQQHTAWLAKEIAKLGAVVVSGGALGVDIIAQQHALPHTIMVAPCSLDYLYPPSNARIIEQIATEGLILSEYAQNTTPHRYSFLERNRLVIALSDVVIIPEANLHSGSMSSARYALHAQKPLFVLPHRLAESAGTQTLLAEGKAQSIYDIEAFCQTLCQTYKLNPPSTPPLEDYLSFFKTNPTCEQAYARYGTLIDEYELQGLITRRHGRMVLA